jgi:hypothetical protein
MAPATASPPAGIHTGRRKASLAISMEDVQEIGGDHKIEISIIGESNRGHPLG